MNNLKLNVFSILETKIRKDNMEKVLGRIGKGWKMMANYESCDNGRV